MDHFFRIMDTPTDSDTSTISSGNDIHLYSDSDGIVIEPEDPSSTPEDFESPNSDNDPELQVSQ